MFENTPKGQKVQNNECCSTLARHGATSTRQASSLFVGTQNFWFPLEKP